MRPVSVMMSSPGLVVTPLLRLGYPPLGMRLDSDPALLTLDGVDNAGINFILAREKTLQGLPKKEEK